MTTRKSKKGQECEAGSEEEAPQPVPYEPGHVKRFHQAMAAGDSLAKILPKQTSVIVLTDSNEYDEEEVNGRSSGSKITTLHS